MVKSSRLAKAKRNKAIKDRKDRRDYLRRVTEDKEHFSLEGQNMTQTGMGLYDSKDRDPS